MIKLNETSSANVSLVGEDELSQVVGGYCHRRRRHCGGGWRRRENRGCGYAKNDHGYEGEKYENEGYESDDHGRESSGGDVQIANVAVTVNIAQVQA